MKKMNLNDLTVKSFTTSTDQEMSEVRGGGYTVWCPSQWTECGYTDLC